jgi:hypothetical protein
MASVSGPKPAPTFHEGKPNQILRITPMVPLMVVATDGDGRETAVVVWAFGKMQDGGVGIFVGATPQQVRDQIKVPSKAFIENVRAAMEEKGYLAQGELTFFSADGQVPSAPAPSVDTSVFDDSET